MDTLERHGALDVAAEVHDLLADGGDEGVRGVFLGKVVARDGKDELGRLGRAGHAEHRAREEHAVRLGRGEALELASCGGVDLRSAIRLPSHMHTPRTVLVSMKMVVRPRPPGTIPSPLSLECWCQRLLRMQHCAGPTSWPLNSSLYTDVTASSLPKLVRTRSALASALSRLPHLRPPKQQHARFADLLQLLDDLVCRLVQVFALRVRLEALDAVFRSVPHEQGRLSVRRPTRDVSHRRVTRRPTHLAVLLQRLCQVCRHPLAHRAESDKCKLVLSVSDDSPCRDLIAHASG